MIADLRYAARTLGRARGFAASTALTLALGLGATTALFTAVRGILLRPLPYPEPERLVQLWESEGSGRSAVAEPNFLDLQRAARSIGAMARHQSGRVTLTGGDEARRVSSAEVSGDFFAVMGVQPAIGRAFAADERQPGAARTVVIGDALWRERFAAARDLSRLTLVVNGTPHQVVGVMPPGFAFPFDAQLWTPAELRQPNTSRTAHNWQVVARLRDGVPLEAARAELTALARDLKKRHGSDVNLDDALLVPLRDDVVGRAGGVLLLLLAGAGVLLLVASANVATLLLARGESRRREIGVRLALGASRGRLLRQFLAEVALVAAAGCAAGVLAAQMGARLLIALAPTAVPRLDAVRVDGAVLAFAVGLAIVVATVLGLGAGWRATRVRAGDAVAAGERAGTVGRGGAHARGVLVGAQVALTAVLLVGAGLLTRSFLLLTAVDPGFHTEGTAVVRLAFPPAEDSVGDARVRGLQDAVVARLRALPGVVRAGSADELPLGGFLATGTFIKQDTPDEVQDFDDFARATRDRSRTGQAAYRRASPGYFEAVGMPLVRGRLFDERDGPGAPPVAVISASLAKAYFGDRDPTGRLIQFGNMDGDLRPMTVVGIVGDVREAGLDAPPQPVIYANARQRPAASRFAVVLAGDGRRPFDAASVLSAARAAVRDVDPTLPVIRTQRIEELYAASLANRRAALLLAGAFAVSALLLAIAGLYGVVSYIVAQRGRELGVRVALGASGADVRRLVVGRGLRPAVLGLGAGLLGAAAAARLLAAQLYEVRPADPLTFVVVGAVLLTVARLAAWGPARRAARVDPIAALRAD